MKEAAQAAFFYDHHCGGTRLQPSRIRFRQSSSALKKYPLGATATREFVDVAHPHFVDFQLPFLYHYLILTTIPAAWPSSEDTFVIGGLACLQQLASQEDQTENLPKTSWYCSILFQW